MAYSGYRLKINNTVLSDAFISKGTYKLSQEDRVVDTWKDANQVNHVVTDGTRSIISFQIREHGTDEHYKLTQLFRARNHVQIEYFDDITESYRVGDFRIPKIMFSHYNLTTQQLRYNATAITLEEY